MKAKFQVFHPAGFLEIEKEAILGSPQSRYFHSETFPRVKNLLYRLTIIWDDYQESVTPTIYMNMAGRKEKDSQEYYQNTYHWMNTWYLNEPNLRQKARGRRKVTFTFTDDYFAGRSPDDWKYWYIIFHTTGLVRPRYRIEALKLPPLVVADEIASGVDFSQEFFVPMIPGFYNVQGSSEGFFPIDEKQFWGITHRLNPIEDPVVDNHLSHWITADNFDALIYVPRRCLWQIAPGLKTTKPLGKLSIYRLRA